MCVCVCVCMHLYGFTRTADAILIASKGESGMKNPLISVEPQNIVPPLSLITAVELRSSQPATLRHI